MGVLHRAGGLSDGLLVLEVVMCPWTGQGALEFDVSCVAGQAVDDIF